MANPSRTHPPFNDKLQVQLDRLDDLLIALGQDRAPQAGLILEHLAGIRTYLIDGLPGELALNLDLAEQSLPALPNARLRARVAEFLKDLRDDQRRQPVPRETKSST